MNASLFSMTCKTRKRQENKYFVWLRQLPTLINAQVSCIYFLYACAQRGCHRACRDSTRLDSAAGSSLLPAGSVLVASGSATLPCSAHSSDSITSTSTVGHLPPMCRLPLHLLLNTVGLNLLCMYSALFQGSACSPPSVPVHHS